MTTYEDKIVECNYNCIKYYEFIVWKHIPLILTRPLLFIKISETNGLDI